MVKFYQTPLLIRKKTFGVIVLDILEKIYLTGSEVLPKEPLSRHTSIAVGGPAKALIIPNGIKSLLITLKLLEASDESYRIMGMGTNLLVSDRGLNDFVVKMERLGGYEVTGEILIAESGISLKRLCEIALERGLSGLEELYGIPGSAGGAVYMNAGAYGKEIKDVLEWVELFNGEEMERLSPGDLNLGYRSSDVGRRVITKVALRLKRDDPERVEKRMREFLRKRLEKQPVFDRSAGSLFKRPKPNFYIGSTLEALGLKGYKVGGMKISEKHAGFLVNEGDGSFQDAMKLVENVRKIILKEFGENLEMEVVVWK